MPGMSGTRLKGNLAADYLTQIQTAFPIPGTLQAGEITALQNAQQAIANALANAGGPDIVAEVANISIAPGSFGNSGGPVTGLGTGS